LVARFHGNSTSNPPSVAKEPNSDERSVAAETALEGIAVFVRSREVDFKDRGRGSKEVLGGEKDLG
jgi:hypothetical protein